MRLLALFVFFCASPALAALDCGHCRSAHGDLEACVSVCGGKPVAGPKSSELYKALQAVTPSPCAGAACSAAVKNLSCDFPTDPKDPSITTCSFRAADGSVTELQGIKAKRLAKAVNALGGAGFDTACGGGTCHFRQGQDIACNDNPKKAKGGVECEVSTSLAEAPLKAGAKAKANARNAPLDPAEAAESQDGEGEGASGR